MPANPRHTDTHAHGLARQIRPLPVIVGTCSFFLGLALIVAVAVMSPRDDAEEDVGKKNRTSEEAEMSDLSNALFWVNMGMAFAMTVSSGLFLTATYIRSMWLTIPYMACHGLLLAYSVIALVLIYASIEEQHPLYSGAETVGHYVIFENGSFALLATFIMVAMLIYTFIPVLKFFNDCRLQRALQVRGRSEPERRPTIITTQTQELESVMLTVPPSNSKLRRKSATDMERSPEEDDYEERHRRRSRRSIITEEPRSHREHREGKKREHGHRGGSK